MNDEEVEEFLEHHGIRGMKWGKRMVVGAGLSAPPTMALTTGVLLGHHMNTKLKEAKANAKHAQETQALIAKHREEHMSFVREFNKKQYRLNASANEELGKLYKMNDTPIANRDYLPILPGQTWGPLSRR